MSKSPELMISHNKKILDLARYNGRVNLMDQPDPRIQFAMAEKVAIKNKATDYRCPLSGQWEESDLSRAYFSAANIQIIQNGIRAGVYTMSGSKFTVAPQNVDTIKIIMRSIYLQYAEHNPKDVSGQIAVMNKLVLDYAVPYTFNEAVGYMKYMEDVSTLVKPLELPTKIDKDYKNLESNREFFIAR
jgi:hypothetical protein